MLVLRMRDEVQAKSNQPVQNEKLLTDDNRRLMNEKIELNSTNENEYFVDEHRIDDESSFDTRDIDRRHDIQESISILIE